jgi:hypothetical protein
MTSVGCSSNPVKTEVVKVYVPQIIEVPENLTSPVPSPDTAIDTNADLADYALKLRAALDKANRQLEAIRALKP